MICIGYIPGLILSSLYSITTSIPWYELYQITFLILAFSSILYVFANRKESLFAVCLVLIILVSFDLYTKLQYTKTVYLTTIASYFLINHKIKEENKISILGILILFNSICMRRSVFMATSCICIPLFIPGLYHSYLNLKNRIIDNYLKKLAITATIAVCLLGVYYVVKNVSFSSDEWKSFKEYNSLRISLMDKGWPDYETYKDTYNKYGIDDETMTLYLNWNFNDPDVLSNEAMKELISVKETTQFNLSYIKDFIIGFNRHIVNNRNLTSLVFVASLLLLIFFTQKHSFIDYTAIGITGILFVVCNLVAFYKRNCVFVYRVSSGFLVALVLIILYYLKEVSIKKVTLLGMAVTVLVLVSYNFEDLKYKHYEDYLEEDNKLYILNKINEDADHLYVKRETDTLDFIDSLFVTFERPLLANLQGLGEWTTNSPLVTSIQKKYGITNYYRDIVNNEKAYFIDDRDIDDIVEYIRKYYYPNAEAVVVKQINEYYVYKLISK